jgi:RNA polymerase sigma-70 factor (ECF subfamily)
MGTVADDREERFATLYEASYGAVHAFASRRAGAEAADEIAAETFLLAWRRFDAIPAAPLPWLYGVARNVVLRHYTTTNRRQLTSAALAREQERAWSASGGEDGEDPRLWEAWEQLRPTDREVLALVAWEELSVTDAAGVLGCSAPVFSVRLHRARRRLERLLSSDGSLSSPELSKA